ncbi:MAG: hypothetical protein VKL59_19375 [Nostocaceae cyanobacterium]|nr:hypothetical protein [Nostocaceae cyanobacterium]
MTPTMLRHLWSVVETSQANMLLKLDDPSLVQWLIKQIKLQTFLDRDETHILTNYIKSRLNLIRDMAQERDSFAIG